MVEHSLDLSRPKTLTVPDAGKIYYGLGRNASYEAAKRGDIPTIRVGRLLRVPVAAIEKRLEQAGARPPAHDIDVFKPMLKGSLRGIATVRLRNGVTITDIPVCTSHGRTCAFLPSEPILSWPDRITADRWLAAVAELVRQHHSDALDGGGAP